jgi:hypothetical protein
VAGTGHTLGIIYASHYWQGSYLPLLAHADGSVTVEWLTGRDRGEVRTHRTRLNPDGRRNFAHDDHPVTERCMRAYECAERALRADRRASGRL